MNWEKSLDNMLARGPFSDGFESWAEDVVESLDDKFFNKNEEWVLDTEGQFNEWLNKLHTKSPQQAAEIIQRAKKLFR